MAFDLIIEIILLRLFITELWDVNMQLQVIKSKLQFIKTQLLDKNSQFWPFYRNNEKKYKIKGAITFYSFFYSLVETGFMSSTLSF